MGEGHREKEEGGEENRCRERSTRKRRKEDVGKKSREEKLLLLLFYVYQHAVCMDQLRKSPAEVDTVGGVASRPAILAEAGATGLQTSDGHVALEEER